MKIHIQVGSNGSMQLHSRHARKTLRRNHYISTDRNLTHKEQLKEGLIAMEAVDPYFSPSDWNRAGERRTENS